MNTRVTGLPAVAGVDIEMDEHQRFNLNALHKAGGAIRHKSPADWLRNKQTQELIQEMTKPEISGLPVDVIRGGANPGTFAHELLAVSYAGWISPAFQLKVNQVFLDYRRGYFSVPGYLKQSPELAVLESAAESLRMNPPSVITMYHNFGKQHGISTGFLPAYTDEAETDSLTNLLAQHGCKMSAQAINQILVDMGYLEEKQRPRNGKKPKRFKSLTEKGLTFGANRKSVSSIHETQPLYYVAKFGLLLEEIRRVIG